MKQRLILSLLASFITLSTHANDGQSTAIKFIVPYSPGGITDELARDIAIPLSDKLGTKVIIEYKPGSAGVVGANFVSNAKPDGRTFLVAWSTVATAGLISPVPYNVLEDLTPVSLVIKSPMALIVNSDLPVNSFDDFIQLARKSPGKLNYATTGVGSVAHLTMKLAQQKGKFELLHVPYKGQSEIWPDFLAGRLDALIDSTANISRYSSHKRVKILSFTSESRLEFMPHVATFAESRLKGFNSAGGFLIFAPNGTPESLIDKVSQNISFIVNSNSFKSKYNASGLVSIGSRPEQAKEFVVDEIKKWKELSGLVTRQ